MRKFWLKDGGTEHSLQSDELFFYAPAGLGLSMDRQYENVEDGFWAVTSGQTGQAEVTGTLVFRKNAYEKYREIADFIAGADALQLVYCPYGAQKYYMDICVDMMEKSEIAVGVLEVPVQIHGTSPWRLSSQMRVISSEEAETGVKRYGYSYPHHYSLTGIPGRVKFKIAGHFAGGVELNVRGPLTAPVFTVKNADTGEVCGKVDLSSASIAADETLRYSSLANSAGIWKEKGTVKTDMVDSAELIAGQPLFMRIPVDTWLIAELSSENSADTVFEMTVHEYWRTR